MKCPFCGHVYTEYEAAIGCNGCPFSGSCGKAKCPNCGFETPKEVGLVKYWNRWRMRRRGRGMMGGTDERGSSIASIGIGRERMGREAEASPNAEGYYTEICPNVEDKKGSCCALGPTRAVALTEFKADETGKICSLKADNPKRVQKLLALGVLPGLKLKVIQTYPVYVIQIGYTQIAIDNGIAGDIIVKRD